MISSKLQRDLVELTRDVILKDIRTQNSSEETVDGVTVYEQTLPEITEDEDDPSSYFPYCIVRMGEGKTEDDDDCWHVSVEFLMGAYDRSRDKNGHRIIMEMIQKVIDYFERWPLVSKMFRAEAPMAFALQDTDQDTYPYFFGGAEIKFSVPKAKREEPDDGKAYC